MRFNPRFVLRSCGPWPACFTASDWSRSFVAGMQILPLLGINIGPLLASAGIAGLAIGFGAQTLVRDVINGFFILIENQFDIGDVIKVAGVTGNRRKTDVAPHRAARCGWYLHNVPNGQITIVSNLTRDWTQLALHISVGYNENSDRGGGTAERNRRRIAA